MKKGDGADNENDIEGLWLYVTKKGGVNGVAAIQTMVLLIC